MVGRRFTFGGHEFAFQLYDTNGPYEANGIHLFCSGDLALPPDLEHAVRRIEDLMPSYSGKVVFFNGPCLVVTKNPVAIPGRSGHQTSLLDVELRKTTYYAKAIARDVMHPELRAFLERHSGTSTESLAAARNAAISGDGFKPLRNPGAGISLCIVARDHDGQAWTFVEERGLTVAVNPGCYDSSLSEAFAIEDIDPSGRVDPYRAARRAAQEELGITLDHIQFCGFGLDPADDPQKAQVSADGYVLVGWATTSLPAELLVGSQKHAPHSFEGALLHKVRLDTDGITQALALAPPDRWFGPAVYALAQTLAAHGASAATLSQSVEEVWQGERRAR
jgi:ADP-ribose pyrophosphatase YjhB (NUDIX family)